MSFKDLYVTSIWKKEYKDASYEKNVNVHQEVEFIFIGKASPRIPVLYTTPHSSVGLHWTPGDFPESTWNRFKHVYLYLMYLDSR